MKKIKFVNISTIGHFLIHITCVNSDTSKNTLHVNRFYCPNLTSAWAFWAHNGPKNKNFQ